MCIFHFRRFQFLYRLQNNFLVFYAATGLRSRESKLFKESWIRVKNSLFKKQQLAVKSGIKLTNAKLYFLRLNLVFGLYVSITRSHKKTASISIFYDGFPLNTVIFSFQCNIFTYTQLILIFISLNARYMYFR